MWRPANSNLNIVLSTTFFVFVYSRFIWLVKPNCLHEKRTAYIQALYKVFHQFWEILVWGTVTLCATWRRQTEKAFLNSSEAMTMGILNCTPIDSPGESSLLAQQNAGVASLQWDEQWLCIFWYSAALCFTKASLSESIPDSGLHLPGFRLHQTDCVM